MASLYVPMAHGGGFYSGDSGDNTSLTRTSFEQTVDNFDQFPRTSPWQGSEFTTRHPPISTHTQPFDELFSRLDSMAEMISSTQKLVFEQDVKVRKLSTKHRSLRVTLLSIKPRMETKIKTTTKRQNLRHLRHTVHQMWRGYFLDRLHGRCANSKDTGSHVTLRYSTKEADNVVTRTVRTHYYTVLFK